MRDYTNHSIFIGLDVHKKTYSVTAICEGQVIKKDTIPASPQGFINYCQKFFPKASIFSAYEAGFCGFYLHRQLIENGINNIVVHASSIEIASRDRVKTDKRDSLKIATQLSTGRLRSIYVPSIQRENYRAISRLRDKFIKDQTRIGVRIKSFLNLNGLANHLNKRISLKFISEILELVDESEIIFYLKAMARQWLDVNKEIKTIEKKLKSQASSEPELERIYQSVPGIGPIASRVLINELGDMSQFKNEKSLFSYTGLTPQEYSSGEHIRQGHISRQGKPVLRKILVQAAWTAIKRDEGLKNAFERVSLKAGKKRAIVSIARRLIGHVRACLQKNEEYQYKEMTTINIV